MPALLPVWAATGTVEAPDNTKISVGWLLGEKPPHEYMNWWQNLVTQKVNHVLTEGVAGWDSTINYPIHALAKSSSGIVYRATAANTNSAPPSANWKRITEDAAALSTGVLPNGRLNAAYTGILSLGVTGAVTAGSFVGNGASLTALNAAQVTTGVLPSARLTGSYVNFVNITASGTITGTHAGNGAALVSLNASQLASGTVADARLPATMTGKTFSTGIDFGSATAANQSDVSRHIALYGSSYGFNVTGSRLNIVAAPGAFTDFRFGPDSGGRVGPGGFYGVGANLTALNASQLTSGTLSNARMAGNYTFANLTLTGNVYAARLVTQVGGSTPNICPVDDSNTGIHLYGENTGIVDFYSNGTLRMRIAGTAINAANGAIFGGSGANLTNLDAGRLSTGIIPMERFWTGPAANSWVGARMSDLAVSTVGMFAFASDTVERSTGYGSTRPGNELRLSNAEEGTGGSLGSGTAWRCLGLSSADSDQGKRTTLWQRVS